VTPVVLCGETIRLEPLSWSHLSALTEAGADEHLWEWTPVSAHTPELMREFVDDGLRQAERGAALPFTIVVAADARIVGSTRLGNVDLANRRAEIGWTWVARPWQRTRVNTEAKYLLLHHAFETLGCIRVEFKADALNIQSRAAILRLGAKEEGVFRKHLITSTGRIRDTVWYSITDDDWPAVRDRLVARLR
jgi:N-acetyltransferase